MLSDKIQEALNEHVGRELQAAHLYLAMSAYCASKNLSGFTHWLRMQFREELIHAMAFFDYVNDRDGRVRLQGLAEPRGEFDSVLEMFKVALETEQAVSKKIDALYALCSEARDYATQAFVQRFVTEQVEEEAGAMRIVRTLEMIGDDHSALLLLDRELGTRSDPATG